MKSELKIRYSSKTLKSSVVFIFLMLGYYPGFIVNIIDIPYWGRFCNICILVSFLFFVFDFFKHGINKFAALTAIFFVYLNIVTLAVDSGEILDSSLRMIKCLTIIFMVEYIIRRYGYRYLIGLLMVLMEILNYVNALCMVLVPNGLYRTVVINGVDSVVKNTDGFVRTDERVHWLLGHQTTMIRVLLLGICVSIIYALLQEKHIVVNSKRRLVIPKRSCLLILVCLFEMIKANSTGNILFIALFIFLIFIQHRKNFIRTWHVLVSTVIFYTSAAVLLANSAIIDFMSTVLHRSVDLLARIQIWAAAFVAFLKSPIWGNGYINELGKIRSILPGVGNPHSDYFWILYEGGVIGIIIFVLLLILVGRKCEKSTNKVCIVAFAAFICFMVMILDDDHIFRAQYALILMSLCYHAPDVQPNNYSKY